ncbi:MAG: MCE family protein [Deltaproteobacteria bacterium]|nr:MCE family protein [Deltaproteobacteria bacterium]
MSKQVSKTVIGGFVISSIALLVVGVFIFGGGKFFKRTQKFVLFFEGSVKGLSVGSPVTFRGVEIGSVESVTLRADREALTVQIPVVVEVEPDRIQLTGGGGKPNPQQKIQRLIDAGLRAQLTVESMVTGQLMIALNLYPDKPAKLVGTDPEYPEIPTIPSAFEQVTETIQKLPIEEIFQKLLAAVDGIEKVLNSPDLEDTIASLKVTVQNADKLINNADKLVRNVDGQVGPLAESIKITAMDAQKLLKDVDGEIVPLASSIRTAADAAKAALVQGEETLKTLKNGIGEDSALVYELRNSLKELSSASRSIRVLADYLEQNPDALIRGKSSIGGK